jgi:16S rRNA processing protein RimM
MVESVAVSAPAFLEMATILRPWGREGAVATALSTDRPDERFRPGVVLEACDGGTRRTLTVDWWRPRGNGAVIKFREVVDIGGAEELRGSRLGLPRAQADALFGRRPLLDDLRGLVVESTGGERLGEVVDIEEAPPQILLVVETGEGEVLLPFHEDLCRVVDAAGGRLVVDPPPGLFPARED